MVENSSEREFVGVVGHADDGRFNPGVIDESEVGGCVEGVEDEIEGESGGDKEEKAEEVER